MAEKDKTPEKPTEDKTPKCVNHPHRKAEVYTGNDAYSLPLCDECTPAWFKD